MRWAGQVAGKGEKRCIYMGFDGRNLQERGYLENLGVYNGNI
jgi:hypothetical protein